MRWALVLSGGGAKGFAHIGVLKALEELGMRPNLIVGTSMGAIVGGLYCSGMSVNELEEFARNFDIDAYLEGFAYHVPDTIPFINIVRAGEAIKNLMTSTGMDGGRKLYELFKKLTHDAKIEELKPSFCCNALDLVSGEQRIFDSGSLADAMRASMSFPGIFSPWEIDGGLFVDGGIVDNMPVWAARKKGHTHVIGVNVSPHEGIDREHIKKGLDVIMRSLVLVSTRIPRHIFNVADLEIVASDATSQFDFGNPDKLIKLGYEKTMEKKKEIRMLVRPGLGRLLSGPNTITRYIRKKLWEPDWKK
ncbi:patatin-like phospholipase family protein [Spirochaetia bacterium 38H-sp]|uniref:Patatin-like phospholipase family protein n=1 Tax=Rarispira pelagica TaxID=3141764 RepID=A0ABU9U9R9_9SPIR